ncbi:MAG: proline--tRNA ligase [Chloroflexi bacterium]|nr:proline--tRNA ligase [Chloroflexota bacterium]
MRVSTLFQRTLRETPTEAETASHQLLVRAGMINQLTAGGYSFLPLGLRALRKIEAIIREEMNAAGGQEVLMPALQPAELWEESGRSASLGPVLIHLKDRRDRELVLGATHEEVITLLGKLNIRSYRDLPATVYQVQTKFRDEPRPRAGLIRGREFIMKDAYTFHASQESLDETYEVMKQAYHNIFSRCGLPTLMVGADSGAIGGKDSHEFMLLTPTGEDQVLTCNACGYSANAEKAAFVKPPVALEPEAPLTEVATPNTTTIKDLAALLNIPESKTIKAVFYNADGRLVFVTIRGDLEVNEIKLKNTLKATDLRMATDEELRAAGMTPGYASPVGLSDVFVVADDSVTLGNNFVVGANRVGYHLLNANAGRDFSANVTADIAEAQPGDRCATCGNGTFGVARGIEVGHIFKLGVVYSRVFGCTFLDREGQQHPAIMGCYGIGVTRLLGAAVEQNHDDRGILWPAAIAPLHVSLVALNIDQAPVQEAATRAYDDMRAAGLEVLFDDRSDSAGVKFSDADLIGLPVRVTVSPRTLRTQSAEVKLRAEAESRNVPLADLAAEVKAIIETLVSRRAEG